jgi:hypothetical protein
MNKRISGKAAGYMELEDAVKDADCETVEEPGGVSKDGGCCNNFTPEPSVKKFTCGTCEFVTEQAGNPDRVKPLGKNEARKMPFMDVLNSDRPADESEEQEK